MDVWRKIVQQQELEVKTLEAEREKYLEGEIAEGKQLQLGIRQLHQELDKLAIDRVGVYFNVGLQQIDAKTGAVTLIVDKPVPHQIKTKLILFAFDDDPKM